MDDASDDLGSIAERVSRAVDEQQHDLVAFLSTYVRFPSVNPRLSGRDGEPSGIADCQQWLADQLRDWGCYHSVEAVEVAARQPNIVARRKGTGGGRGLFFNGHSDVVPVTAEQQAAWRDNDPWSGAVADGRVWGRGSADMKGGISAYLWAIKVLHDLQITLAGDCYATVVIGEETGDRDIGIGAVMDHQALPKTGIIAEATDLQIAPATMGEFYFRIVVEGQSCTLGQRHRAIYPTAYGEEIPGHNAIDLMWRIQQRLGDLERQWGLYRRHPLMEPGNMSINVSQIHGGSTYSAMADRCEVVGSVLYAPNLTFEEVSSEFRAAIQQVVDGDDWLRQHPPEVLIPHFIAAKPANDLPIDHPLCVALGHACQTILDGAPVFSCPGSATNDGNYMVERGYETITFGTRAHGIHGTNEYVWCDDLVALTKIYALFMITWCGFATR